MAGAFDDLPERGSPQSAGGSGGAFNDLPATVSAGKGAFTDTSTAISSGGNRALLRILGLPVDAAANALDLGKAAIGAPYMALTGKPVPSFLEASDRREQPGSSEWLLKQAQRSDVGRAFVNPSNPADEGGYLQTISGGAVGALSPGASGKQAMANAVMGVLGGGAGKAVYDATGNQALAMTAGMTPLAGAMGARDLSKYMVRGGEAGRQNMAQRQQDFAAAGVENPSLGLASGNKLLQGTENILASAPGSMGVMERSRQGLLAGLMGKVDETALMTGPTRGVRESGTAIQSGLKDFQGDWKATQNKLWNDKLGAVIPPDQPTNIGQTRDALAMVNKGVPGAPALSEFFKNAKLQALEGALRSDTGGTAPGVMQTPTGSGGLMNGPVLNKSGVTGIPSGAALDVLPFQAVKQFRTLVGNEIADSNMMSAIPRSKWNPVYGALSGDIRDTAAAVGPQATNAFNRANDYTRSGVNRLEKIAPFADATSPEASYLSLMSAAKENTSTFQAVKKSLPESARGTIAGTAIERMGTATPGQQDATGGAWSPSTFLTNYNKLSEGSRAELFSGFPDSAKVRANVESTAQAAAMLRDSSKVWANPSGTASRGIAYGTIAGIAGAAGTGNMPLVGAALGGLAGTNLAARGLTNKQVTDYFARPDNSKDWLNSRNSSAARQLVNMPGLLESLQRD